MDSFSNSLAAIRQDYCLSSLDEKDAGDKPVSFFERWFKEAEHAQCMEVNAMTLATVDAEGKPHARTVLLKGLEDGNFIFFSNYNSHKGQQLVHNDAAALLFFWPELQRQVRIEGRVSRLSPEYSDEYFYSRPIGSQIGAIASAQSSRIPSRAHLEARVAEVAAGQEIKRPEHWGGYALKPERIEFWQGRSSRLHDRIVFEWNGECWEKYRLAP